MSQGAAHTRFAFSTSVTPYKNATRKHELIIIIIFLIYYLFIFGCIAFPLLRAGFLQLRLVGCRHAGFSSCGARASLLRGMWDLPRSGLEPVSAALAGGFLTTAPPGKP